MYTEDDLLPLSALQHIAFCPRQCALIHVEQLWLENRLTAEGKIMHERVHDEWRESRGDIYIEYGVSLRSLRLGLIGKADVVEYHRNTEGLGSSWIPFPVEYKRGRPKKDDSDKVQLCAQALCLEEMLGVSINKGALFYGKTRRRVDVRFDDTLRRTTESAAQRVHDLVDAGETPNPSYSKKCDNCSLINICLPKNVGKRKSVKKYIDKIVDDS
jgi:CRISPR-associated exonuclease Cas4